MAFKRSQQKLAHNAFAQGDSGHVQLLKVNMEPSNITPGKKRQVLNEMLSDNVVYQGRKGVSLQFLHSNVVSSFLVCYHVFKPIS